MGASITGGRTLHKGWLTLTEATIRLEDGTEIRREVEDHGRAVAVLPYDPERKTATLVRLLRAPPLWAGEEGEVLEAPAGIMDEDDPTEAARREALEETGLRLDELEQVVSAWSMPGISTERMTLFLAPHSAASRVGPGGGLAEENENITVVEMPLDALWGMQERGELLDMKTIVLVFALRARHPHLFSGTPGHS